MEKSNREIDLKKFLQTKEAKHLFKVSCLLDEYILNIDTNKMNLKDFVSLKNDISEWVKSIEQEFLTITKGEDDE